MDPQLRRRSKFIAAIVVIVVLVSAGGTWLYRSLRSPGEVFGSVPDGLLSDLVWQGEHLYFAREPWHSSDGATELWRVDPHAEAVQLEMVGGCEWGQIEALASRGDGRLAVVRECKEGVLEISALDLVTHRLEPLVRLPLEPDGTVPPVERVRWLGETLLVSGDRYVCSGIGRAEGSTLVAIPPLTVDGAVLDLGRTYERERGDCRDLPLGGFVTVTGGVPAFLAAPEAAEVEPTEREDVEWFLYRAAGDWSGVRRFGEAIRRPIQVTEFEECGVLVAGELKSPGVWLLPWDGGRAELVVKGSFSDFAVDPEGGRIALLEPRNVPSALRLLRWDSDTRSNERLRRSCGAG